MTGSKTTVSEKTGKEKGASKGRIAFWILVGLIPIFLIFFCFSFLEDSMGADRYEALRTVINDKMPAWAMILFIYLVESCIVPATPMLVFPMLSQYPWWVMIPLTSLAAIGGGMTAYWMGRLIEKIPFVRRVTAKAYAKWGPTIMRWGPGFVWIGALFPLPFSGICMAAGVMKLPWRKVWPATVSRFIRMTIYYFMFV